MATEEMYEVKSADELEGWRLHHIRDWNGGMKRVIAVKGDEGRDLLVPSKIIEHLIVKTKGGCCG